MTSWRRAEIAGAGVAIDQHPDWPLLSAEGIVYQRSSDSGTVSVRWGAEAAIDEVLAHVGLGSAGAQRTVEADEPVSVDGVAGRRVRLRVRGPDAVPSGSPPLPRHDPERVFGFLGFAVAGTPVLVGYSVPASEWATSESLLEHVLASVQIATR